MSNINWSDYEPLFYKHEFDCQETGENEMTLEFMNRLYALRSEYDKPMVITSGYRSPDHSIERDKPKRGEHTYGNACDVAVYGENAYNLIKLAMKHGFTRIGIKQRGDYSKRFIHLGLDKSFPNPTIWSY